MPCRSQCDGLFVFLGAMHQNIELLHQHFLSSSGISTDSRKITPNCMFFALKGEHFDGNIYAHQALEVGAQLAVVDDQQLAANKRCFVVRDVLKTLQELAIFHRNKLTIPVLSITGSNGKTTTKELIGKVLEKRYPTFFTRGNLNNHIGVPLTVLSIRDNCEMAIVEMGANHPGEIADLCMIAKPDYGIITNIGKAHLEGFGDYQGVINAKNELYEFLVLNHGKVFVNADDPLLMKLSEKLSQKTYGTINDAGLYGFVLGENPFLNVQLQLKSGKKAIQTKLIGGYNLPNILAAACVSQYFQVDDNLICEALEEFTPENNRSQCLKTKKNTLILDAYNANPTSMALAIRNFADLEAEGKMMVLGDMLELGKDSLKEHKIILELINDNDIGDVILVGNEFHLADSGRIFLHFSHVNVAEKYLSEEKVCDHMILIKGSRGIQLEKLVEVF